MPSPPSNFLCLSIFLLILLPLVHSVTPPELNIMILHDSFNHSIVNNSIVQEDWSPGNYGKFLTSNSTSWLFIYSSESPDPPPFPIPNSLDMIKASNGVSSCNPFVLNQERQLVIFPLAIPSSSNAALKLMLVYNCSSSQSSNITLSATFTYSFTRSVSFGWIKSSSTTRNDLNIGAYSDIPSIVKNGIINPIWSSPHPETTASVQSLSNPLYLWMEFPTEKQKVNISVSSSNSNCWPYIEYLVKELDSVIQQTFIIYNCTKTGMSQIDLEISMEGSGFGTIFASWNKFSGPTRNYFMVGTQPNSSDVVWWGFTMPLWSNGRNIRGPSSTSIEFYFWISDPLNPTQEIGKPVCNYDPLVANVSISGPLANGGNVTANSQSIKLEYNCLTPGKTELSMDIPISGYANATWKWQKNCGLSLVSFSIGTKPNIPDVVQNGEATLMYSPIIHSAFVFPSHLKSTFYLYLEPKRNSTNRNALQNLLKRSDGKSDQHGLQTSNNFHASHFNVFQESDDDEAIIASIHLTSEKQSCSPILIGNASIPNTPILRGEFLVLEIIYNCSHPGNTVMQATVSFGGPRLPVSFAWTKRIGNGLAELSIGTYPFGDDVVSVGNPTPQWDPATYTASFGPWLDSAKFFVSLLSHDQNADYIKQRVISLESSSNTLLCFPHLISDIKNNSTNELLSNGTFELVFRCPFAGTSLVNITLQLEHWPPLTISMTIYSGGPRPHFDIGTTRGAADVVMGGVAAPLWLPGEFNGAAVSGAVRNTTFWLGMSYNQDQLVSPPVLAYRTHDRIINPILIGTIVNGGIVGRQYDQNLTIIYNCTKVGSVTISITFLFPMQFDPVQFWWTKSCDITRNGFGIGTSLSFDDVVSDGEATMAWNPLTHIAFVLGIELKTTFYVSMKTGAGGQRINSIEINSSLPICSPYIEGYIHPGTILLSNQTSNFTVVYNCSDIGESNIFVSLDLEGAFIPPAFMWTKRVGGHISTFDVGTKPNGTDVVWAGAPTFGFDPIYHTTITSQPNLTFWASTTLSSDSSSGIGNILPSNNGLKLLPVIATANTPWIWPEVSGELSNSITLNPSIKPSANFTIIHHCCSYFAPPNSPAITASISPVPYDSIRIAYGVNCPINMKPLQAAYRSMDKSIDVPMVEDGLPLAPWSPSNNSRTIIEADENSLQFLVSSSTDSPWILSRIFATINGQLASDTKSQHIFHQEANQARRITAEDFDLPNSLGYYVPPPNFCSIHFSGQLFNSMQITETPQLLEVTFNCSLSNDYSDTFGSIINNNISIILVPANSNKSSTIWSFKKSIGGYRHGLGVLLKGDQDFYDSELPVNPAHQAQSEKGRLFEKNDMVVSNVDQIAVLNGASTHTWKTSSPTSKSRGQLPLSEFIVELVQTSPGRDSSQSFSAPHIITSPPNICFPLITGDVSQSGKLQAGTPQSLNILPNCYNALQHQPLLTSKLSQSSIFNSNDAGVPSSFVMFTVNLPLGNNYNSANFSWLSSSSGLPLYLNIDLISANNQIPIIRHGQITQQWRSYNWAGHSLDFSFYIDRSLPTSALSSGNLTLDISQPILTKNGPDTCHLMLSGNGTAGGILRTFPIPNSFHLNLQAVNCSKPGIDFTLNLAAYPFVNPIEFSKSVNPTPPAKAGFPPIALAIILGGIGLIIIGICIGLYFCFRRSKTTAQSTKTYGLKKRKDGGALQKKSILRPKPAAEEEDQQPLIANQDENIN